MHIPFAPGSKPPKRLDSQAFRTPPQPGRPATKGQEVTAQLEHLLAQNPSHFGSMEEGWTVDLIRHYLAQQTGDVSDSTVRHQRQAGGWVYKRFAQTVPLNAPSAEKKKLGWQQSSPPSTPVKRSDP
jgi:hypothetical protein